MAGARSCMLTCVKDLVKPVMARLSVDGEERYQTAIKLAMFAYSFAAAIGTGLQLALSLPRDLTFARGEKKLVVVCCLWIFVQSLCVMGLLWRTRRCSVGMFQAFVLSSVLQVCVLDLYQVSEMDPRASQIFIVLLDIMLIGRMPRRFTNWLLALMVGWLLLVEVELVVRFGLADIWGTQAVDERFSVCDCAKPPCAIPVAAGGGNMLITLFVFGLDYFITRRFAIGMEREQQRVAAVVETAISVAAELARFELVAANASLVAHGAELPPELFNSFTTLIENLGRYKPYLPQSCLPGEARAEKDCFQDSPSVVELTSLPPRQTSTHLSLPDTADSDHASTVSNGPATPNPATAPRSSSVGDLMSLASATSSPTPSFGVGAPRAVKLLSQTKITLLNITAHLPPPQTSLEPYTMVHERLLSAVLAAVRHERGVVDAFFANCFTASFNVARPCALHSVCGLRTAYAVAKYSSVKLTGAVATGQSWVGVLGNESMLRQSIVGPLPGVAKSLELFGTLCGYRWVCNMATFKECRIQYPLRVILDHAQGGFGDGDAGVAYELLFTAAQDPHFRGEWMYELERTGGRKWDAYNTAGTQYIRQTHEEGTPATPDEASTGANEYFGSRGISSEDVELFAEALSKARVVDLRPRVVRAAARRASGLTVSSCACTDEGA